MFSRFDQTKGSQEMLLHKQIIFKKRWRMNVSTKMLYQISEILKIENSRQKYCINVMGNPNQQTSEYLYVKERWVTYTEHVYTSKAPFRR